MCHPLWVMHEVSILLLVYTRILGQQKGMPRTLGMPFCTLFEYYRLLLTEWSF